MCVSCIRKQEDITEGIPKRIDIFWCKGCERYQEPPLKYVHAAWESRELLHFCLRRIKGVAKGGAKLVDAGFVYTEPHSKRIKIKITIQKEVLNSVILQQVVIIEYVINNMFCTDCHKVEAHNTWGSVLQVRQRVKHKRTFLWLEQVILKHTAHEHCVGIKEYPDGLDFYFQSKSDAVKFLDFLQTTVPVQWNLAKQLTTSDLKSNTYTYKYSFSVEIVPICKEDLVLLPKAVAKGVSQLVVCTKVSGNLYFIDPFTLNSI